MSKRVSHQRSPVRSQTEPETCLRRATEARTSGLRAKYATRGLARAGEDPWLRAMLLRQLYLSHMEGERFEDALEAAREAYPLSEMPDVVCQDIARALLGSGKEAAAAVEMTRASRLGPPSRRAFHLWTLGSLYFLRGEYQLSASVFERAVRWGTTARPLYQAQLTLARRALGEPSVRLEEVQEQLEAAPCGQGYGRFVRGEIAFHLGQHSAARELLSSFVEGTRSGRKALQVGLSVELRHAVKILKDL